MVGAWLPPQKAVCWYIHGSQGGFSKHHRLGRYGCLKVVQGSLLLGWGVGGARFWVLCSCTDQQVSLPKVAPEVTQDALCFHKGVPNLVMPKDQDPNPS